jgi:hypothetical protein
VHWIHVRGEVQAAALHELVQAKIEQRAPEIVVEAKGEAPKVINIMAALKESVEAKGRVKARRPCASEAASRRKRNTAQFQDARELAPVAWSTKRAPAEASAP